MAHNKQGTAEAFLPASVGPFGTHLDSGGTPMDTSIFFDHSSHRLMISQKNVC